MLHRSTDTIASPKCQCFLPSVADTAFCLSQISEWNKFVVITWCDALGDVKLISQRFKCVIAPEHIVEDPKTSALWIIHSGWWIKRIHQPVMTSSLCHRKYFVECVKLTIGSLWRQATLIIALYSLTIFFPSNPLGMEYFWSFYKSFGASRINWIIGAHLPGSLSFS